MSQTAVSKDVKPSSSGEDEFLIAADLTLYANPLRCLTSKKKKTGEAKEQKSQKTEEKKGEEEDIIAADLTKYGSPLDDRN